jgi:hypothetical protein
MTREGVEDAVGVAVDEFERFADRVGAVVRVDGGRELVEALWVVVASPEFFEGDAGEAEGVDAAAVVGGLAEVVVLAQALDRPFRAYLNRAG